MFALLLLLMLAGAIGFQFNFDIPLFDLPCKIFGSCPDTANSGGKQDVVNDVRTGNVASCAVVITGDNNSQQTNCPPPAGGTTGQAPGGSTP